MNNNKDMDWLKRASHAWVDQNNMLGNEIKDLIKERTQLIEEYRKTPSNELEQYISEIDKLISDLLKQMQSVDLPIKIDGEGCDV